MQDYLDEEELKDAADLADADSAPVSPISEVVPEKKASISDIFPGLDFAKLKEDSEGSNKKKEWLGVAAALAKNFDNIPSAYSLLYGDKKGHGNSSAVLSAAQNAIQDPWEKQKKTYELYKTATDTQKDKAASDKLSAQNDISKQDNDPSSSRSKNSRIVYGKILSAGGVSDEQVAQMSAAEIQRAIGGINASEKISNTHADTQAKIQSIADNKKIAAEKKNSDEDKKDSEELDTYLSKGWSGRSGQAGQVQAKINAAEYAEGLLEQGKGQKNGLDSRQIEELAQSTARMLGGNAAASARVEALVPHTFFGRAQTLKEWLTNNPEGSGQEEFVKRMAETVQREKQIALNQKRQYQVEGLAARSAFKKRNGEQFNKILQSKGIDDSMVDENGRYRVPVQFPMTVTNGTHKATVNSQQELDEAKDAGFQ